MNIFTALWKIFHQIVHLYVIFTKHFFFNRSPILKSFLPVNMDVTDPR